MVARVAANYTYHEHADMKQLNDVAKGLGVTSHELIYQFVLRGIWNILDTACNTDRVSRAGSTISWKLITTQI
jgi:hypothetical protein